MAIINFVSGVGVGVGGIGAPFGEGGEGDTGGGGNNVFQLSVGLCNEVKDSFDSRGNESLAFFPARSGDEGDKVVDLDSAIGLELTVPCEFAVIGK